MSRPAAKGWCPGAYHPMMSGDGLVVRVRPVLGRLTKTQALTLCELATRYGSGLIDLTSRANLQIRGVAEADHETLLQQLNAAGLLPDDPTLEARRNILMPLDWTTGDDTHQIANRLMDHLAHLPELPAKMGYAIDTGVAPILHEASADFRFERSTEGLILRADGASRGRPITADTAINALQDLAEWFVNTGGIENRRMKRHLAQVPLPSVWATTPPLTKASAPPPGSHPLGALYGAAFGQIAAAELRELLETTACNALRTTPWRLFLLEDAVPVPSTSFITKGDDPLLRIDACPGAPLCASSSVDTRTLARALAGKTTKSLHISGCSKGCARPRPADLTLVGEHGHFGLVKNGLPWDAPQTSGLTPDDLIDGIGDL